MLRLSWCICVVGVLASVASEVTDFEAPGPEAPPANVTYIAVYSYIRYFGSANAGANVAQLWCLPFVARSALIAWERGLVLESPARRAPTEFRILFIDECRNVSHCGGGYAIEAATRAMLGNRFDGQHFPGAKALVGGYFNTAGVAQVADAFGIPNVGFVANRLDLSDKSQYPMFLRVNPADGLVQENVLKVVKALNFTRSLLWLCNNNDATVVRDSFQTIMGPRSGITITTLLVPMSGVTGCYVEGVLKETYEQNLLAARLSGVHSHILWNSMQCPGYDLMHWLALEGLVGQGHFWITGADPYLTTLYKMQYFPIVQTTMCPPGAPREQQVLTPFASPRALESLSGFTTLVPQQDRKGFQAWWTWFQSLRADRDVLFDSWYAPRIASDAWDSFQVSFWRSPASQMLFDGIWAALRGINALTIEKGSNFTGRELYDHILHDSFNGITGRVQFDANGDRISNFSVAQWRDGCGGLRRLDAADVTDADVSEVPLEVLAALARMEAGARRPWKPSANGRRAAVAPAVKPLTADYVTVGTLFGNFTLQRPLLFYGCSARVPPDRDLPCEAGSFYDSFKAECASCQEGRYSASVGQTSCTDCPGGMYSAVMGMSSCLTCLAGHFSSKGSATCVACAPGTFNADVQMTSCRDCAPGSYASREGATGCPLCAVGFFQPRSAELTCKACPDQEVTASPGSVNSTECTCAVDWFRAGGSCKPCGDLFPSSTVRCGGGEEPPILQRHFMTLQGGGAVYLCRSEQACPGRVPVGEQACSTGASGVACALCSEGYLYDTKGGYCKECVTVNSVIFFILVTLGCLGLVKQMRPVEITYGSATLKHVMGAMFVMVPIVQLADFFQFQSILGRTAIGWPEQSGGTFKFFSGILDFGSFGAECFVYTRRKEMYPLVYVLLMNMLPAFLTSLCFLATLPSIFNRQLRELRFPNPLGAARVSLAVVLMFFLTILNWALNLVFATYLHPDGLSRSLRYFPHILTSDKIMGSMRAVAIVSILVWCVGTFSLIAFLLYLLPRRRQNMFLRRCMLTVVARYTEDLSWWVLVELTVKVLTCITLSIFDDGSSQLVWLGCVYIIYQLLACTCQPFRFRRHAVFDILFTLGKVLTILFANPLLVSPGSQALGVSVTTYLYYVVGAICILWCLLDRLLGQPCDVEREEAMFERLWHKVCKLLPIQHNVEEVAPEADSMKLSRHTTSHQSGREAVTELKVGAEAPIKAKHMTLHLVWV